MKVIPLFLVERREVAGAVVEGFCSQCGDCCESGNPYTGGSDPCPHFERLSPERGVCRDHHEGNHYWNIACRHWPSKPNHPDAYARCTYRVTRVG